MTKTHYGIMLVAGIAVVILSAGFTSGIGGAGSPPSEDFANDIKRYAAGAVGLVGIGMFFYGAMKFSRG